MTDSVALARLIAYAGAILDRRKLGLAKAGPSQTRDVLRRKTRSRDGHDVTWWS